MVRITGKAPMRTDDIASVIRALLDPNDSDHVDLQRYASPPAAVSEAARRKDATWGDDEVHILAYMLRHRSSTVTARWVQGLSQADRLVRETIRAMRPAQMSLLLVHTTTFVLGVALVLVGAGTALLNRPEGGILLGGLGFATLAIVFLRGPIKGIQRRLTDAVQLEIILTSYAWQRGQWSVLQEDTGTVATEIRACGERADELLRAYVQGLPRGKGRSPQMRNATGLEERERDESNGH